MRASECNANLFVIAQRAQATSPKAIPVGGGSSRATCDQPLHASKEPACVSTTFVGNLIIKLIKHTFCNPSGANYACATLDLLQCALSIKKLEERCRSSSFLIPKVTPLTRFALSQPAGRNLCLRYPRPIAAKLVDRSICGLIPQIAPFSMRTLTRPARKLSRFLKREYP